MSERTVYSLLEEAAATYGKAPALYEPLPGKGEKQWRPINWLEYKQAVEEIAAGLRAIGIQRGDIVALGSETRLEFYLADLGVMVSGAVAAAMYTAYPVIELVKTIQTTNAKAVFVENAKMLGALESAAESPLLVQWIVMTGDALDALSLDDLRAQGRRAIAEDPALLDRLRDEVKPDDYAILYLTSGATGEPKMGLVTHRALVANVDMGPAVVPIGPHHCSIAFLPSAHITQRVGMELLPLRVGMPVYFSEGLSRLPHELKSVRPTFFVAPPRVWERMYSSICTEIKKRGVLTQRIFYTSLGLGSKIARLRQEGRDVPGWMMTGWRLADKIVFTKIRERLGGRLAIAVSGAAPLGKDLADFFAAIGLPIFEGYGLTEGGIVALNPQDRVKSGSIGKPLPGVEMKIASDGELIFRSPSLFSCYYNDKAATDAILQDGWLHTGDIAEIDSDGYVFITGRKKEVLVSSNGKKIFPALIEGLFKMEPMINQVLLVGDKLPYVAALFTLHLPIAESLKGMEDIKGLPAADLIAAPPLQAEMKKLIARINKQLAPFEQIRKFHLLERDFTIEDGELTPTMKVRRARVLENHRAAVSGLYMGREEAL